jgi:tetratricopeptide (TPR) repeat protein
MSPDTAGRRDRPSLPLLLSLVLVAGTVGVFAPACRDGFVFDDEPYITSNPHVLAGLNRQGIDWAISTTFHGHWHPLTWMSLQLDQELYGLNPWGCHLTNVLLHAASVLLLFLVLWRMTGAVWRSALVAALFGVHPLHVESVAWAAERKDVLSTFFWMLTLAAYLGYVTRPGAGRYLLMVLFFALGLLAKPMLVTLPFVLLLLDYWPLGRLGAGVPLRRLVWEKLPLLALVVASSAVTYLAQTRAGAANSLDQLPFRAAVAVSVYVAYLGQALWPTDLAPFYPYPRSGFPLWQVAGAALLLALVSVLTLKAARRRPYLLVGWLWYLGTLVPVIGLVQVLGGYLMADRYTYVPLIGPFIMLAWGLADLAADRRRPTVVAALAATGIVGACLAATWVQVGYWRDSVALWQHTLEATRDNHVAHYNLGVAVEKTGKLALAMRHFAEAVRIAPNYWKAHNNLASALAQEGKLAEAVQHYQAALEANPDYAVAENNLGTTLRTRGDMAGAIRHYEAALRIEPGYAEAHHNLASALLQQGAVADAVRHEKAALAARPGFASALHTLGIALALASDGKEALGCFQQAVRLQPTVGRFYFDLAYALMEGGHQEAAAASYRRGLRLEPRWPQEANRIAWSLATCPDAGLRNGPLAVRLAEQVVDAIGGAEPYYLDTLAAAYAEVGRFAEAQATVRKALRALDTAPHPDWVRPMLEERQHLYESLRPLRTGAREETKRR